MVKALTLSVYSNPTYRGCANGGWTEGHDTLYVACPDGFIDVDADDPALFVLRRGFRGTVYLEPNVKPQGKIGGMMGGSYAGTSDSRFSEMCEALTGHSWHGAVAVHDRFETQREYDILSR